MEDRIKLLTCPGCGSTAKRGEFGSDHCYCECMCPRDGCEPSYTRVAMTQEERDKVRENAGT